MAKPKLVYHCTACGAAAAQWAGQCADCGAWNSLTEEVALPHATGNPRFQGYAAAAAASIDLAAIGADNAERYTCGIQELDRVLGGGLVAGSVILIGGDPGVGKSTLLLQVLAALAGQLPVLYVTGEESLQQVALRARRLNLATANIHLLTETSVERIIAKAQQQPPQVMVIDSIQAVYTELLQSAPGAVSQVRESAAQLVRYAKQSGTALFLVGHVTKEGALAGPRVLEHMVDTVLYFEGDTDGRYRIVRAVKNRYGAVNELGVFIMTENGLREISNPSAIFLSRHEQPVAGSIIMVTREGSRPLLIEVQALVDECRGGNPRRVTLGMEQNRLAMLLAVLHRHGGVATYDQDVFVNVVGGVRVNETGADLPVLLAVLSSLRNRPLPIDLIAFGELGLAGEIRPVAHGQERLREAVKQGFRHAIIAKSNAPKQGMADLNILTVSRLSEALDKV